MKKLIALSVISLVLTGCVNPGKASVQPDQLKSHRFVLENVDGKAVKATTTQPEISCLISVWLITLAFPA